MTSSETAPPLDDVLAFVVDIARSAGALIRAEYERPDGPRGRIGSCPVDDEAEALIRDGLRARFPDWQFFGEESGTTGAPSRFHWLVDPNDGTSAFQRGHPGSSVSIALLRDTELVLGVVFAPRPPIGQEDLITWFEGGPVTRNGAIIERRWADELSADEVVLVSQGADVKTTVNLDLAAPARFRGVASVAYRLALAAVGEGQAAISIATTSDYDFAGGHAIIMGAGGIVVGANGKVPEYAPQGGRVVSDGGLLVGGSPTIVRALASRPWSRVHAAPRESVPFALPRPKGIKRSASHRDRSQGLLLGQFAGDALGAQVEFESSRSIAVRFPSGVRTIQDGGPFNTLAGQPTDDSEMALALARSLVRNEGYDVDDVAAAYVDWYLSGPFDIGTTTQAGCGAGARAAQRNQPVAAAMRSAANAQSQSNGGLMRISPIALAAQDDATQAINDAMEDAKLTHPHPVCVAANAVFVAALVDGLNGGGAESMVTAAADCAKNLEGADPVLARLEEARTTPPTLDGANIGWVLHALQNAFFELLHAPDFETGLVRTVGRGGDTDTNGAIAGALLGAAHGATAVPLQWRQAVLTCRAVKGLARNPRPQKFWPVDALHMAERLARPKSSV